MHICRIFQVWAAFCLRVSEVYIFLIFIQPELLKMWLEDRIPADVYLCRGDAGTEKLAVLT